MYGYIYKTTNIINNKIYIGQKKNSEFLKDKYLGSGKYLKHAIKKYGKENFKVELLDTAESQEDLDKLEKYYISYYNALDFNIGYNIANGAVGGGDVWVTNGIENHHISKVKVNEYLNHGYRLGLTHHEGYTRVSKFRNSQISKSLKGKPKSKEHIEKHRQALLQKKRHWYTNGVQNICISEDEIIPEGYVKGRTITDEQRLKASQSCKDTFKNGRTVWNKGLKNKESKK